MISAKDVSSLTVEALVSAMRDASSEEVSAYCEELIVRFQPLLKKVWGRVHLNMEYADFVQEVFLRLFSVLPMLQQPKAFPGYFHRVCISVLTDLLRAQSRAVQPADTSGKIPEPTRQSIRQAEEEILNDIYVRSYLQQLSGREKDVLTMEYLWGFTSQEIAALRGITPGAVRTARSRGLLRLRQILLSEADALERNAST